MQRKKWCPSIWTLDYLEQIQLAARRGLKLGASGLKHPALLPLGRGVTKWYVSSFPINGFPAPTQHQLKLCSIFPYWFLPHAHREKSLPHVSMVAKSVDLNKPWSCKYGQKNYKDDMNDFPVHHCTPKGNGSSYFPSIVRQCKWPSRSRKIVEIQKLCNHSPLSKKREGNWTQNLSPNCFWNRYWARASQLLINCFSCPQ